MAAPGLEAHRGRRRSLTGLPMMRRGQDTIEAVRIAVAAIRANKARGVLTTLGIVIGIVGVITTMTAANGLANNFKESVSALGSDVALRLAHAVDHHRQLLRVPQPAAR